MLADGCSADGNFPLSLLAEMLDEMANRRTPFLRWSEETLRDLPEDGRQHRSEIVDRVALEK